ncbi:hypothetical protein ES332_A11G254500v1 [Gossypium tomentosum]|uniref:Uncharacterized protein n=1 Tax=Gossypium tomentosum TaxID=34277 RepID=A0A5D2NDQ8_GOSTO|nr:hypothetical protein ES332_A11G254500v1 [Gossypium tomentosum]
MLTVNRVINWARSSISNCQYLLTCKQGKNRERMSKTISLSFVCLLKFFYCSADELNRGYFDDMFQLKQHGGSSCHGCYIFYGRKSKLPIVFDASGIDASKLAVPEASLVCLSFRASSQVSFIDSLLLCLNPIKRLLLRFMRKSSDGAKDALQRHIVYSFGDHYYFRKELKILNLLTGYIFLLDKFGRIRWLGFGLAKQGELSSLFYCTEVILEDK